MARRQYLLLVSVCGSEGAAPDEWLGRAWLSAHHLASLTGPLVGRLVYYCKNKCIYYRPLLRTFHSRPDWIFLDQLKTD
jgi:hypothetical protein